MSEWIKVEERLPEVAAFECEQSLSSAPVLARMARGGCMVLFYAVEMDEDGTPWMKTWAYPESCDICNEAVTHWQPLPEAPNED